MKKETIKEKVIDKLKQTYDPEIPVNIYDLGLIYDVREKSGKVAIKMTLTSMGCPMAGLIVEDVKEKIEQIVGVKSVKIDLVFDPPWTPERMTKEAKIELGVI
jgi:FeS assembly SUF system protein